MEKNLHSVKCSCWDLCSVLWLFTSQHHFGQVSYTQDFSTWISSLLSEIISLTLLILCVINLSKITLISTRGSNF